MKKHNDLPSKEVALHNHSRRKFLTGAGASALALPFLSRAAHAQTCVMNTCPVTTDCLDTSPPVIPGKKSCKEDPSTGQCCTAITPPGSPTDTPPACSNVSYADDGKWLIRGCIPDTACGYNAANIRISGVRHYCGNGSIVSAWPTRLNQTSGQTGPFFCMTIYPNINDLISKPMGQNAWDSALHNLFSTAYGRDMLSCWHEVAYTGSNPHKFDADGEPITAFYEKKMQDYLLEFRTCYGYTAPAIGAIECDNGDKNSDGTPNYGIPRIAQFVTQGLDFVADDLYYNNQKDPLYCLTAWDNQWGHGAGTNATISVTECNVSEHYDWQTLRPLYFNRAAWWLWNQGNKGARCFLTYWRYDGYVGLSGPWISDDTDTIAALQAIGKPDAKFPDPGPVPSDSFLNNAVCWANGLS